MSVSYLDVADEITDAVTRLRAANDKRVILVLPPGSRIGTSRINFRLLLREAQQHGVSLDVVSGEPGVRALAASAGARTFGTVGEAERQMVIPPPPDPDEVTPSRGTQSVAAASRPPVRQPRLRRRAPPPPAALPRDAALVPSAVTPRRSRWRRVRRPSASVRRAPTRGPCPDPKSRRHVVKGPRRRWGAGTLGFIGKLLVIGAHPGRARRCRLRRVHDAADGHHPPAAGDADVRAAGLPRGRRPGRGRLRSQDRPHARRRACQLPLTDERHVQRNRSNGDAWCPRRGRSGSPARTRTRTSRSLRARPSAPGTGRSSRPRRRSGSPGRHRSTSPRRLDVPVAGGRRRAVRERPGRQGDRAARPARGPVRHGHQPEADERRREGDAPDGHRRRLRQRRRALGAKLRADLTTELGDPANTPQGLTIYPETAALGAVTAGPDVSGARRQAGGPVHAVGGRERIRARCRHGAGQERRRASSCRRPFAPNVRPFPQTITTTPSDGTVSGSTVAYDVTASMQQYAPPDHDALVQEHPGQDRFGCSVHTCQLRHGRHHHLARLRAIDPRRPTADQPDHREPRFPEVVRH